MNTPTPTPKGDTVTSDPFPWEDAFDAPDLYPVDEPDLQHVGDETRDEIPPAPEPEVVETEPIAEPEGESLPAEYRGLALDPDTLLDALADSTARSVTCGQATDAVRHAVRVRADARRTARITRLGDDGVKHSADLRLEAVGAANDADVLDALAGVFTAGAKEAKGVAADLLSELPERGGKPRRSVKVADGEGFELSIVVTGRSELSVKHDEVDDVLAAWLLSSAQAELAECKAGGVESAAKLALSKHPAQVYAAAVRDTLTEIRSILASSPTYRSTALDSLVKRLGDAEEDDLASRLRNAYGKVEKGEPSVKLDRKPLAPEKTEDEA